MRPEYCPQGHALVWLTHHVAVCGECDEDNFIYRHEGYLARLAKFVGHKMGVVEMDALEAHWRGAPAGESCPRLATHEAD